MSIDREHGERSLPALRESMAVDQAAPATGDALAVV